MTCDDMTIFQKAIRWLYVKYVLRPELDKHVSYRIMLMNDEAVDAMYEKSVVGIDLAFK